MSEAVLERWKSRAAVAEANRAAMPIVTSIVDELRAHFPDCKVSFAQEGERSFGKRGAQGVAPAISHSSLAAARGR